VPDMFWMFVRHSLTYAGFTVSGLCEPAMVQEFQSRIDGKYMTRVAMFHHVHPVKMELDLGPQTGFVFFLSAVRALANYRPNG